jgi:homoserine kinase
VAGFVDIVYSCHLTSDCFAPTRRSGRDRGPDRLRTGGFDTLGVAVEVYLRARIVDVRDDGGSRLTVARSVPAVSGGNAVERAFALIAERTGRRAPSVTVDVTSDIPMAAGLGSSAAATVAGLRLFERVTGPLDDSELLGAATKAEGHADNAAPALFGGLNSVIEVEGGLPYSLRWSWPRDLRLVVATPVGPAPLARLGPRYHARCHGYAIFNMQECAHPCTRCSRAMTTVARSGGRIVCISRTVFPQPLLPKR